MDGPLWEKRRSLVAEACRSRCLAEGKGFEYCRALSREYGGDCEGGYFFSSEGDYVPGSMREACRHLRPGRCMEKPGWGGEVRSWAEGYPQNKRWQRHQKERQNVPVLLGMALPPLIFLLVLGLKALLLKLQAGRAENR